MQKCPESTLSAGSDFNGQLFRFVVVFARTGNVNSKDRCVLVPQVCLLSADSDLFLVTKMDFM